MYQNNSQFSVSQKPIQIFQVGIYKKKKIVRHTSKSSIFRNARVCV